MALILLPVGLASTGRVWMVLALFSLPLGSGRVRRSWHCGAGCVPLAASPIPDSVLGLSACPGALPPMVELAWFCFFGLCLAFWHLLLSHPSASPSRTHIPNENLELRTQERNLKLRVSSETTDPRWCWIRPTTQVRMELSWKVGWVGLGHRSSEEEESLCPRPNARQGESLSCKARLPGREEPRLCEWRWEPWAVASDHRSLPSGPSYPVSV